MDAEESEGFHLLHTFAGDKQGCEGSSIPSEVQDELLGFGSVQFQVIH